jgi:hypothetical protein
MTNSVISETLAALWEILKHQRCLKHCWQRSLRHSRYSNISVWDAVEATMEIFFTIIDILESENNNKALLITTTFVTAYYHFQRETLKCILWTDKPRPCWKQLQCLFNWNLKLYSTANFDCFSNIFANMKNLSKSSEPCNQESCYNWFLKKQVKQIYATVPSGAILKKPWNQKTLLKRTENTLLR